MNRTVIRSLIAAGALGAGAIGGVVSASLATASGSTHLPAPSRQVVTHWSTNAHGQTFGSALKAVSPADEPDLIQAIATNGHTGYVYRTALEGDMPTTPAQALAQQAAEEGHDQTVPVYESDGVTQIGVFVITHNGGQASPPPTQSSK